ncbi:MAG: hypothetical protein ACD_79C00721G0001 [uncultured bacterium]|nr:MAG: hypothetical protein ACD_79C00721G0001 [uncultured bacterium]
MKKNKAFTLIELLAVIAVIMVIMGLLVPIIGKAMQKSNISATKAVLAKLEIAIRNYQSAFGVYPPNLTYQYLGKKLFSRSYGAVMPVLMYEPNIATGSDDSRVYKDSWDEPYCYYWNGITQDGINDVDDTEDDEYNILLKDDNYLEKNNLLEQVIDLTTWENLNSNNLDNDMISHGFVLWSKGSDCTSGTEDDLGNWGFTRNKVL